MSIGSNEGAVTSIVRSRIGSATCLLRLVAIVRLGV